METNKTSSSGLIMLSLAIGTFMSALDTSVANIALPVIQSRFGVGITTVEWVITAYLLVVSSLLLLLGRFSDLYGHRRVYLTGFCVFTAGSLLCGLSGSVGMLIACRVVQAIGAAMMFSTNSAIIVNNVPPERRGRAFSVIAVAVAVACCAGPVLGGLLAGLFGWQSVFFINIPFGIAGLALAWRTIPKDGESKPVPFDFPGGALVFAALFLILLPLDQAGTVAMSPALFASLLASGVAAAVLFVLHERKFKYPLLNLALFRNRVFSASLGAAVFNYMAQFIMAFLAPFYLEKIRLLAPAAAGLLYLPMPLATMAVAPLSGMLSDRHDSRYISSAGMGVMAAGLFLLSFLNMNTPNWFVMLAMALAGCGSGMFQTPNSSAVMGSAPLEHRGMASGTLATMRNVGMVLGVATSGALFTFFSGKANVVYTAAHQQGAVLQQASFTYGLHITFIAAGVVALLAMAVSFVKGRVKTEAEKKLDEACEIDGNV
jgi:EmrB/QacA subfamily drug resistance transporter